MATGQLRKRKNPIEKNYKPENKGKRRNGGVTSIGNMVSSEAESPLPPIRQSYCLPWMAGPDDETYSGKNLKDEKTFLMINPQFPEVKSHISFYRYNLKYKTWNKEGNALKNYKCAGKEEKNQRTSAGGTRCSVNQVLVKNATSIKTDEVTTSKPNDDIAGSFQRDAVGKTNEVTTAVKSEIIDTSFRSDVGVQTEEVITAEKSVVIDASLRSDAEVQTDKVIIAEKSVFTDASLRSDAEVQTDKVIIAEKSVVIDASLRSDAEVQTDKVIIAEKSVVIDASLRSDAEVQTDKVIIAEKGVVAEALNCFDIVHTHEMTRDEQSEVDVTLTSIQLPSFGLRSEYLDYNSDGQIPTNNGVSDAIDNRTETSLSDISDDGHDGERRQNGNGELSSSRSPSSEEDPEHDHQYRSYNQPKPGESGIVITRNSHQEDDKKKTCDHDNIYPDSTFQNVMNSKKCSAPESDEPQEKPKDTDTSFGYKLNSPSSQPDDLFTPSYSTHNIHFDVTKVPDNFLAEKSVS